MFWLSNQIFQVVEPPVDQLHMLPIIKLPAAFGWNSKADDVYSWKDPVLHDLSLDCDSRPVLHARF